MVASLVISCPVAAADLGDVADQDQRADRHARRHQRQRPHAARSRRGPRSPCGPAPRRAARRGSGRSASVPSSGSSASRPVTAARSSPTRCAAQSQPPVGRLRVRAGVGDLAGRVEPDQAVADPRGAGGLPRVPRRRERAVGDHLGQVVGGGQVVELQLARGPRGGEVGVAADDGDHLAPRRGGGPGSPRGGPGVSPYQTGSPSRQIRPCGRAMARCATSGPPSDPADLVVLVGGRARWSAAPAPRRGTPAAVVRRSVPGGVDRHPQQQVGEGEVGDSCQSPARRCRWSTSVGPRVVCSSTRSRRVDTRQRATDAVGTASAAWHGSSVAVTEAAGRVRVLAAGQREGQRQPLQRQDVQQRRVAARRPPGVGPQPGGAVDRGRPDHDHVGAALAEPGRARRASTAPPGPPPTTASTGTSGSAIASGPCSRSAPENASAAR